MRAALRSVHNQTPVDICASTDSDLTKELQEVVKQTRAAKLALHWQRARYQSTIQKLQSHTDMLELELSSLQSMVTALNQQSESERAAHLEEVSQLRDKCKGLLIIQFDQAQQQQQAEESPLSKDEPKTERPSPFDRKSKRNSVCVSTLRNPLVSVSERGDYKIDDDLSVGLVKTESKHNRVTSFFLNRKILHLHSDTGGKK